ncbi:MAG: YdiU family protein [Actinomycetota bacterium]|nr:YdiU family protein [Actinomycetota bacterium]
MPRLPLDQLSFSNRFTDELPGDADTRAVPRQVTGAAYSRVAPSAVSAPALLAHSPEVAEMIGLPPELWPDDDAATADFAQVFAGNRLPAGAGPYAMAYGGHQFGNWAGQLGDGRAIALGEIVAPSGEHLTLQLKGSGLTPYSRGADGLAVLRSSIREFLCSEAMHHLGVPTTRALSLVLTGDKVVRDMFYDGNPKPELGAVVCRVAPSFIRFGNFQLPASRGDLGLLRQLVEFTIRRHFPELLDGTLRSTTDHLPPSVVAAWYEAAVRRTAHLMVEWNRIGFVHGVMNTDNLSILGLTIDYGPYGWLDDFDPDWTPNTTDFGQRRYRFGQQGLVAHWNLAQLGSALAPLLTDVEPLQTALDVYPALYRSGTEAMLSAKLGLPVPSADVAVDLVDRDLQTELWRALTLAETDYTIFFRRLADLPAELEGPAARRAVLADAFYRPEQLDTDTAAQMDNWLVAYQQRLQDLAVDDTERRLAMHRVNPKYVLRNYLSQLAIDAAESGDPSMITELLDVLRHPYDDQPDHDAWATKRPDWARSRPGCSTLSCSS